MGFYDKVEISSKLQQLQVLNFVTVMRAEISTILLFWFIVLPQALRIFHLYGDVTITDEGL
jgi:hypothetical protein